MAIEELSEEFLRGLRGYIPKSSFQKNESNKLVDKIKTKQKPHESIQMKYEVLGIYTYRTKDEKHWYQFQYVKVNDYKYEADIISQPSYEKRRSCYSLTHLYSSPRANVKAQIDILNCNSFEKVKEISIQWAEVNSKYIETGITIDQQINTY